MIYVTGDCHGNFRRFQSEYFPEQANMTKDDTVIITGDFGGVWFSDSRADYGEKSPRLRDRPLADIPTPRQSHLSPLCR